MKTTKSSAFLLFISLGLILLASVIVGLMFTFPFDSNTPGIYLSVIAIAIVAFASFVLHTYIVGIISIIVEHNVIKHNALILTGISHLRSLFNTTVKASLNSSSKFVKDFGESVSKRNKLVLEYMEILSGLEQRLKEGEIALKNTSDIYKQKINILIEKRKKLDEKLQKLEDEEISCIKIDVRGVESEEERFILVRAAVKEYLSQKELNSSSILDIKISGEEAQTLNADDVESTDKTSLDEASNSEVSILLESEVENVLAGVEFDEKVESDVKEKWEDVIDKSVEE